VKHTRTQRNQKNDTVIGVVIERFLEKPLFLLSRGGSTKTTYSVQRKGSDPTGTPQKGKGGKNMASTKIIEQKSTVVAEIKKVISDAKAFILVDYRGVTVAQDLQLRSDFRKEGCSYKVYKNTLVRRALKELGITGFDDMLQNTTALAASAKDPVAPARIVVKKRRGIQET